MNPRQIRLIVLPGISQRVPNGNETICLRRVSLNVNLFNQCYDIHVFMFFNRHNIAYIVYEYAYELSCKSQILYFVFVYRKW